MFCYAKHFHRSNTARPFHFQKHTHKCTHTARSEGSPLWAPQIFFPPFQLPINNNHAIPSKLQCHMLLPKRELPEVREPTQHGKLLICMRGALDLIFRYCPLTCPARFFLLITEYGGTTDRCKSAAFSAVIWEHE